uniref:Uncharacterized protein n=1 Tax=Rhizobium phage LG08 TaxID=3129229 RepID=A0AAU8HYR3_9CAUD
MSSTVTIPDYSKFGMKGTPLYPVAYNVQIPLVDAQKYRGDYVVESGKIFPEDDFEETVLPIPSGHWYHL